MDRADVLSESRHRVERVRNKECPIIHARNGSDRRISKTRATLLASFNRLLLENGYDGVNVRELSADADVARSTFYEHFEGKHDLLEHSVVRPLAAIAGAAGNDGSFDTLLDVLMHVRAQRKLASALLRDPTRSILLRVLARILERQLAQRSRYSVTPPIAPLELLALSLAHAQLGAIEAWLRYDDRFDVRTAARVLQATSRAGVAAAFGASG